MQSHCLLLPILLLIGQLLPAATATTTTTTTTSIASGLTDSPNPAYDTVVIHGLRGSCGCNSSSQYLECQNLGVSVLPSLSSCGSLIHA